MTFHEAVAAGKKQRALLYFYNDDVFLTNDDVVLDSVSGSDYFIPEEDYTVGLTGSSTVNISLFNDDGKLNSLSFGKFKLLFGVQTVKDTYTNASGVPMFRYDGDAYSVDNSTHTLLNVTDSISVSLDSTKTVAAAFLFDDVLYLFNTDETYQVYAYNGTTFVRLSSGLLGKWSDAAELTWAEAEADYIWANTIDLANDVWSAFAKRYIRQKVCVVVDSDYTTDFFWNDGSHEQYVYRSKGVYLCDRPARVKTKIVSVSGYDLMTLADKEVTDMEITYPITVGDALTTVCAYCGLGNGTQNTFLGASRVLSETDQLPQEGVTGREWISWIAEAAACNAKIDDEGQVVFKALESVNLTITDTHYVEFIPYEYTVHKIDKLQVRNSDSDIGIVVGTGTNGYVIQENPLLVFSTDEEGRSTVQSIYNELIKVNEYVPSSCNWFGDWTYTTGDIVTVSYQGGAYSLPIFTIDWSWGNLMKMTIACTGNEYREEMSAVNREEYRVGKRLLEIKKTIEEFEIHASDTYQTKDEMGEYVSKTDDSWFEQKASAIEATVTQNVKTYSDGRYVDQQSYKASWKVSINGVETLVSAGNLISSINQSAEGVKIKASLLQITGESIALEGYTTINGAFKIDTSGNMECTGAVINSATVSNLQAGNWVFGSSGAYYSADGGSTYGRITVSGGVARYDTYGMDALYGSDANHTTDITGAVVQLSSYYNSQHICIGRATGRSGAYYSDVSIWDDAAGDSGSGRGNIGTAEHYWDLVLADTVTGQSSRKKKADIKVLESQGEMLDKLVPVSYRYKDKTNKRFGLILEDTEKVIPEICFIPDGIYENGGINYIDLVPILLKEIQDLRKRVAALEAK